MVTAVQQIMLGTVTRSEEEARGTLARIKAAGYGGVELNRFMIHPSSLAVRALTRLAGMPTGKGGNLDWPALLAEQDLCVPSLHCDLGTLEKDQDDVLKDVSALKTDTVTITGMYRFDYRDLTAVRDLAGRLDRSGKDLAASGIRLCYHNHNAELLSVGDGRTAFDVLLEETDPANVGFELDTYWIAEAGGDPLARMKQTGGRLDLWHINDRGTKLRRAPLTPLLTSDSMELGTGNMDLPALAAQAKRCGVRGIVLESHRNWAEKSPVRSLEISGAYLSSLIADN